MMLDKRHETDEDLKARRQEDAEIGLLGYLTRSVAPKCGRCGRTELRCLRHAAGIVCWECSEYLAELRAHGYAPSTERKIKRCRDCQTPVAPGLTYCEQCRSKRRRASKRRQARKGRGPVVQNRKNAAQK